MVKSSLEQKMSRFQSAFVRRTLQSNLLEGIIEIPNALKDRVVELILLPIDSEEDGKQSNGDVGSPLRRFAGAWAGEPLVRAGQGEYDIREELL